MPAPTRTILGKTHNYKMVSKIDFLGIRASHPFNTLRAFLARERGVNGF